MDSEKRMLLKVLISNKNSINEEEQKNAGWTVDIVGRLMENKPEYRF